MTKKEKNEEILKKSLLKKWVIKIRTSFPDNDQFEGIVLHNTPNMVIIQEFQDFLVDGIVAINKKKIKSCRDAAFEKCFNKIIRHNKTVNKISKQQWYKKVDDFPKLLSEIKRRNIWPIVEMISKTFDGLYIGPLIEVDLKKFYIHCYDAEGQWEDEYELKYSGIGKVEFDSNYANTFNNYMKEVNPAP